MISSAVGHVVLLGLMGVGKTTIGRALAAELGWPLSDSDEVIMREQGATVRELSDRLGVEGMHELEAEHLLAALSSPRPSVIGAAASVVDSERCRAALHQDGVLTVWLEANPATLAARFAGGRHRPVLDSDPERLLRRQLAARGAAFAEVARYRVSVEGRAPGEVALELAQAVRSAG
jgi:shikimate kinase